MALSLVPTPEDVRSNSAFEEMMWALSRPGIVRTLPSSGMAVMAESLMDRECSFHVSDDPDLHQTLIRTGARAVSIREADYVFATIDSGDKVATFSSLNSGTLAYPDEAATVTANARFGLGQRLCLTGPGIKDSQTIAIDGIHPSFWELRTKAIRYPLGWDLYLVDGDKIIGLPRSTKIEVL